MDGSIDVHSIKDMGTDFSVEVCLGLAQKPENWNAFTFTNTKAALTDTLTASKAWAGDGAWQALTRPDTAPASVPCEPRSRGVRES